MVVLLVTYSCKPDKRLAFLDAITSEGIAIACRAEVGNLKYDYYLPMDESNDLLLVEKWVDEGALAEHMKQPHFARLGELKAEYVLDTIIEKYEQ